MLNEKTVLPRSYETQPATASGEILFAGGSLLDADSGGRVLGSTLLRPRASAFRRPRHRVYKPVMALEVGDRAPEFTLPDTSGERISLASLRGRPVVLVFLRWLG
jgi:hypothetical protein